MQDPTSIGRYDVIRLLGQGGMGRVWLARDTVLGRQVAVKVLRDDLELPPELKKSLHDRMKQEARAAAALSHPNMVTLHDMGEDEKSGLFLVFEYVNGPTLRERLAAGPLPRQEVARLARDLGAALTHAHEAGVIHRDVKPENVMLPPTGAKMTDFGIARIPDSTLTRKGSILGTPAYSAPESLALADFSPASDQFALAVTLYEAFTGKRAYGGDDALVVATRVATEKPEPIGIARIDMVIARAIHRDKAKRYPSCAAFGAELADAIERSGPVTKTSETPPPPTSVVTRRTRRWQNVVAGAAIVVIVTLVIVGRRTSEVAAGVSLRQVAASFAAAVGVPATPPHPRARLGDSRPTASTESAVSGSAVTPSSPSSASAATAVDAGATEDEVDAATGARPDTPPRVKDDAGR
jgi:serine/threonine-protein kinase